MKILKEDLTRLTQDTIANGLIQLALLGKLGAAIKEPYMIVLDSINHAEKVREDLGLPPVIPKTMREELIPATIELVKKLAELNERKNFDQFAVPKGTVHGNA